MSTTAIVLCGGRSSRFGSDKTRALLEGRPLLDHVLAALPDDWPIVAVGPARTTSREVTWVHESPVFAGPLAALAAGVERIETPAFVLVGADMPYAGAAVTDLAQRLAQSPHDLDAVLGRTPDGRLQPLLLAARSVLSRSTMPTDPTDASLMSWIKTLRWAAHDVGDLQAHDIDTPQDFTPPPVF